MGKNGLEYIIQFVARLLQPSQSESAALFIGDLVVKLLQKVNYPDEKPSRAVILTLSYPCLQGSNHLAPVLPDLLTAAALRLESAKTATFIQSLVLVFAHLIIDQQEHAREERRRLSF